MPRCRTRRESGDTRIGRSGPGPKAEPRTYSSRICLGGSGGNGHRRIVRDPSRCRTLLRKPRLCRLPGATRIGHCCPSWSSGAPRRLRRPEHWSGHGQKSGPTNPLEERGESKWHRGETDRSARRGAVEISSRIRGVNALVQQRARGCRPRDRGLLRSSRLGLQRHGETIPDGATGVAESEDISRLEVLIFRLSLLEGRGPVVERG